jgi:hypothetical protein
LKIEILTAATELDRCGWDDRLLRSSDFYQSSTWLKAVESVNSLPRYYLVATDDRGRALAGLAAHLMTRDAPPYIFYRLDLVLPRLAAMPDRDARGIVGVRGREPLTLMPHLLLGGRQSAHTRLLLAEGLSEAERAQAIAALLDETVTLARSIGARALAFMFIDAGNWLLTELAGRDYLAFRHATAGVMDIDFTSFDGYLERFSAHRRRRIRSELRSFAAADVTFRRRRLADVLDEITPLGMALESRYGPTDSSVADARRGHEIISNAMGDRAVVLTAEQGGKIRGFVVGLHWQNSLVLRSAGFDYDFKGKLPLYYGLIFYHAVDYALTEGVRRVHYSIEATQAKRSRGCRMIDEYGMVRGLDDEAAGALRQVLGAGAAVMSDDMTQ